MIASIVIRTYNEQRYLGELLSAIASQQTKRLKFEVIIVDSGSTDNTISVANQYECKIVHLRKSEFTFGRSLNLGCENANGDIFVFISGHCIPKDDLWLEALCNPIINHQADYCYGRQRGRDTTKYSEFQVFKKCYPEQSDIPQKGFFCNNANAALRRAAWDAQQFDEQLTGLEDMYLAKQLMQQGKKIAYVAEASVHHIHDESWKQVRLRYERESYALQKIIPEIQFSAFDFLKCLMLSLLSDYKAAFRERKLMYHAISILFFRFNYYWGTYKGNQEQRKLSEKMKKEYFYPLDQQITGKISGSHNDICAKTVEIRSIER